MQLAAGEKLARAAYGLGVEFTAGAVDHRSRHSCAVTMQTRTEVGNRFEKRKIAGLERASGGRSFWTLHIDHYAANRPWDTTLRRMRYIRDC